MAIWHAWPHFFAYLWRGRKLLHGDMVILSCEDVTVVGVVSVTLTVKVKTPVAVGLPEITPVPAFKTNPVGSGPVTRAQV
jgi:hypothetical protein